MSDNMVITGHYYTLVVLITTENKETSPLYLQLKTASK